MAIQNLHRQIAIDALRGLVILIMMLDHVRETFFLHHQVPDPMIISETEPTLFLSRTLAHLCAPVFVLLTGLSAFLYHSKHQQLKTTQSFLLKRGLFLIVLELTFVNFAWTGQIIPNTIYLQVIWAIGISMIALAALITLPKNLRWAIALLIICGHNLLDHLSFPHSAFQPLWNILHQRGWIDVGSALRIRTSYPVLPWIGVILLGYNIGQTWFNSAVSVGQRQKALLSVAITALLLFFSLRLLNIYGDHVWQTMPTALETLCSFFNLTKYPPSLLFIAWNVGIGLLLLVLLEHLQHQSWLRVLVTFGSVPMFFYIIHLYVLKLMYIAAVAYFGLNQGQYFGFDHVISLWAMSLVLCLLLYPVVSAFSKFKHNNKQIRILKYF
ncbi:DUF1624 domain-containing protein [Acinetobacter apis]|uniref:Uncharacterized membrane protein n=1 Tax=Acinetobacter apis TaxID=1229165 RepID=A0A217ECX6_9GAMM|nr:heparan-alpha-glucosaminide N-acetyltransferase domain-containing protein [Acinetobacter apis]SNQ28311.1 Uncharacterized membrane protein [Acinetobacter apis]